MKILLIITGIILYALIAFIINIVWFKIFKKQHKDKYYTLDYVATEMAITILSIFWPIIPIVLLFTWLYNGVETSINKLWK